MRRPSTDENLADDTIFFAAAGKGDLETVQTLLTRRPDLLNIRDRYGDTALSPAVRWGHVEVVRALLEKGIDVNAARSGRDEGWSALFWSVRSRANVNIVRLLLDFGANVNGVARHHGAVGETVLHAAVAFPNPDVVRLLLERGANVRSVIEGDGDYRQKGFTPLHVAAKHRCRENVEILMAHGAKPDLFTAACLGDIAGLRTFSSALDARDAYGATPLHWAIEAGQMEAVSFLLNRGGDPNVRDEQGKTPLLLAAIHLPDAIGTLLECGAREEFVASAALGKLDVLESQIGQNASLVNIQDERGWTPLHWAARTGNADAMRLLVHHGAKPNAPDRLGRTPLWPAAYEGRHPDAVRILIEQGADLTVRDRAGTGILSFDVGSELAEILRSAGAVE